MPSQIQLQFEAEKRGASQNQKLRSYFLARPEQWIPMPELGHAIGAWAVHSRVADLRKKFGMTIEQMSEIDPMTRQNLSSYRYVPPSGPL